MVNKKLSGKVGAPDGQAATIYMTDSESKKLAGEEIAKKLAGKLGFITVDSVVDNQLCHGFNQRPRPRIHQERWIVAFPDMDKFRIEVEGNGLTISTKASVPVSRESEHKNYDALPLHTGVYEKGLFISMRDMDLFGQGADRRDWPMNEERPKVHIVEFKTASDLYIALSKSSNKHDFFGFEGDGYMAYRIGQVISTNIYVGDNSEFYKILTSEDDEYKARRRLYPWFGKYENVFDLYDALTALDLEVPRHVTNKIEIESETMFLKFYRDMLDKKKGKEELRNELGVVKKVARFIKEELHPDAGTTITVSAFLRYAENELIIRNVDI